MVVFSMGLNSIDSPRPGVRILFFSPAPVIDFRLRQLLLSPATNTQFMNLSINCDVIIRWSDHNILPHDFPTVKGVFLPIWKSLSGESGKEPAKKSEENMVSVFEATDPKAALTPAISVPASTRRD
jgi:hypothetical protein